MPEKEDTFRGIGVANTAVEGTIIVGGNRNILVGADRKAVVITNDQIKDRKTISSEQAFDRIAAAVKLNLSQIQENIQQARADSSQFFKLTLVFASLGFVVVIAGVILLYLGQLGAGIVAAVSGSIPEVTAALFFRKDQELRKTIELYHAHMLTSQRLLTMIDVAETIQNPIEQDRMKQEIIMKTLVFK
jgi:hypothetical protein